MKNVIYILTAISFVLNISCTKESTSTNSIGGTDGTGVGGSTARFAVIGNTLYTVDHSSLNVFDITNPKKPVKLGTSNIGGNDIETIFPRDSNTIFIGSQSGMYVYNISNPLLLTRTAVVSHFRACDPVVANQKYAFVTLNSEGFSTTRRCGGSSNVLLTYNVEDLNNVVLLQTYGLTKPKGLGLHGKNLFVCDEFLRWYDATNPANLIRKSEFVISAHDIIPLDSSLILVGDDGITQLGIQNDSIWYLSKIHTAIQ
jgi:hypothetical protein